MANYPSSIFNVNAKAKIISCEASDLRLFNVESAFGIKSAKTGSTRFFCHKKTHRDTDNDVTHWEYEPLGNDADLKGWTVFIYND